VSAPVAVVEPSPTGPAHDPLDIIDFERRWGRRRRGKERAIRERFGFSPTRYHQMLNRIIDLPQAIAHDPVLVRRLQRMRQIRRGNRLTVPLGCAE
jgi:hypothetical protein